MASYRYEGKNERCHPLTQFPEGFDIWRTPNHWANGETSICFMKNIILPYISATTWGTHGYGDWYLTPSRDTLEVKCNPYCWGITSPQYTRFKQLHWCTSTTESLCEQAPERPPYDQGSNQMVDGKQPEDTEGDMKLSVMKPLSARWLSLSMPIYLRTTVQCGLHRKYLAKSIEILQGLTRWCTIYLIRLFAWFLQGSCMIWQVLCKNNLTNLG